jgi:hypothetical protein
MAFSCSNVDLMVRVYSLASRFQQHAESKFSAGPSRITRPAELNELELESEVEYILASHADLYFS